MDIPEIVIGTILPYSNTTEPDGWIFCDGIERTNDNRLYDNLLKFNIGSIGENNTYIPPNYSNMNIMDIKSFNEEKAKKKHIKFKGHIHRFNSDRKDDYFIDPCPIFLIDNDYKNYILECVNEVKKDNCITWIIKY